MQEEINYTSTIIHFSQSVQHFFKLSNREILAIEKTCFEAATRICLTGDDFNILKEAKMSAFAVFNINIILQTCDDSE